MSYRTDTDEKAKSRAINCLVPGYVRCHLEDMADATHRSMAGMVAESVEFYFRTKFLPEDK